MSYLFAQIDLWAGAAELWDKHGFPAVATFALGGFFLIMARWFAKRADKLLDRHFAFMDATQSAMGDLKDVKSSAARIEAVQKEHLDVCSRPVFTPGAALLPKG